jgi:hypothetical protein
MLLALLPLVVLASAGGWLLVSFTGVATPLALPVVLTGACVTVVTFALLMLSAFSTPGKAGATAWPVASLNRMQLAQTTIAASTDLGMLV